MWAHGDGQRIVSVQWAPHLEMTPPHPGRRGDPRWAALREKPGEWALYWNQRGRSKAYAYARRNREFETRMLQRVVYVRFVGPATAAGPDPEGNGPA